MKLRLPQGSFVKNILTLSSGTVLASGIQILSSPIISRIYTPADFGLFGTFASILAILNSCSSLGYEYAIVVAKSEWEASGLFWLTIILGTVMSLLVSLLIISVTFFLDIHSIYFFIPACLLFFSWQNSLIYWFTRKSLYQAISTTKIFQSFSNTVLMIGLGLAQIGSVGLALSYTIALVLSCGSQLRFIKKTGLKKTNIESIQAIGLNKTEYFKYTMPAMFLNTTSSNIENLIFINLFAAPQVGAFYFIKRIISIPIGLVSNAIWQVFFKESASLSSTEIAEYLKSKQGLLISITAMPYYSAAFILPDLLAPLLGVQWEPYVNLVYPLILSSHINGVVSCFYLFITLQENKTELIFNAMLIFVKFSSGLISYLITKDFLITLWLMMLAQSIMYIYLGEWNFYKLTGRTKMFVSMYMKNGVLPIIPWIFLMFVASVIFSNLFWLIFVYIALNTAYGLLNYDQLRNLST